MNRLAFSVLVLTAAVGSAHADTAALERYFDIDSRTVEVTTTTRGGDTFVSTMQEDMNDAPANDGSRRRERRGPKFDYQLPGLTPDNGGADTTVRTAGEVIRVIRDLVALGEDIYKLIERGRPVVNHNYAPISVMPKNGGEAVDISETEGWQLPKSQRVRAVYRNGFGAEVVVFEYNLVFAYGGTYNGVGRYITAAQIIPTHSTASWGFTLDSQMTLNGITNVGTRAEPVAAAVLNVKYRVSNVLKVEELNDTYHITGRGQVTKL